MRPSGAPAPLPPAPTGLGPLADRPPHRVPSSTPNTWHHPADPFPTSARCLKWARPVAAPFFLSLPNLSPSRARLSPSPSPLLPVHPDRRRRHHSAGKSKPPPPLQPPHGELPPLAIIVFHHTPLLTPHPTLMLQDPPKLPAEPSLQAASPSRHRTHRSSLPSHRFKPPRHCPTGPVSPTPPRIAQRAPHHPVELVPPPPLSLGHRRGRAGRATSGERSTMPTGTGRPGHCAVGPA
jgi:hypothetical protein